MVDLFAMRMMVIVVLIIVLAIIDVFDWYRPLVRGVVLVLIVFLLVKILGVESWRDLWNSL